MNPNNWNENVRKGIDGLVGAVVIAVVAFNLVSLSDLQNTAVGGVYLAFRTLFWSIFPGYNTAAKS